MPYRDLEKCNKYVGGLLNIGFGIHTFIGGVREVAKGDSHHTGKNDTFICLMQ